MLPKRRVVEASTWEKDWKRRPMASLRNADAGVAHGKDELGEAAFRRLGPDAQDDLALFRELHRVAEEVDDDLAKPGRVAQDLPGDAVGDLVEQVEPLGRELGREEVERPLDAFPQAEGSSRSISEPARLGSWKNPGCRY